ncbi:glycosyltransferase [Flavobacterium sinopsychrotolerans]|uniref:Glycosyltransferase involved in cell wall bisynthesis n=1 Tax=Flavobacterium sinopsychrotolerans TaxID=604089 RepID=A0A1H8R9B6_9FLAO|nr:glycosyltransferase [Flavobacterium sinopsychrotolerans]SEO63020.1 Glycosyltransferase involved in cell wall bisynthesis [Flavobacterium sinopsychrotolerans]
MGEKKIFVFSDCYIYGGSEKLIGFLLKNEIITDNYTLLFAYRKHKDYEIGLQNDGLLNRSSNYPLVLLSNETLFHKINDLTMPKFFKSLFKVPFYIFEKVNLYSIWNLMIFIFILSKTKPSLIHINNGGYPGAKSCNILVLANYLTFRTKIIYQVNNQAQKSKNLFAYYFDRFVDKSVSYFINASLKAKEQLVVQRKFDGEKILVIDNCVPLVKLKRSRSQICEELKIPDNSFIITQVGFLSERKGQRYLINAVRSLINQHPLLQDKLILLLIGNGENADLLQNLINESGVNKNVFLLGYRNDSDDFIAACDVFVLPSISDEDMPLVLLTALGQGKPIIATDFAGISQVIQSGKNGILIKNNLKTLVEDLVIQIYTMYCNEILRNKLSANAQLSYRKYTPENYGLKLKAIYESVYAN